MKLDIILRTCSKQSITQGLERIVPESRDEMILKCVDSLIKSANKCDDEITIKILDDHSDENFLLTLDVVLKKCKHTTFINHLAGEGFNNSAYEQFKAGSECEGFVYFVEDDYFHTEDSIASMLEFFQSDVTNDYKKFNAMAISPFDSPHRYWPRLIDPTLLFYQGNRYWRTITNTSNTMMIHSSVIRTFWAIFESLALGYPKVKESDSINLLFSNLVQHGGPIACFSPIPSLAYHISYKNEPPNDLKTNFTNWEKEWEHYEWN